MPHQGLPILYSISLTNEAIRVPPQTPGTRTMASSNEERFTTLDLPVHSPLSLPLLFLLQVCSPFLNLFFFLLESRPPAPGRLHTAAFHTLTPNAPIPEAPRRGHTANELMQF